MCGDRPLRFAAVGDDVRAGTDDEGVPDRATHTLAAVRPPADRSARFSRSCARTGRHIVEM